MASQASELIGGAVFPATVVAVAVLLAIVAMLSNAPGEWGRGALTAYVSVIIALIAGMSVASLGGWVLLVAVFGVIALIIGGPWGLILAGAGAAALTIAQFATGPSAVPIYVPAVLSAVSIASALKAMLS